ncbi:MAG: hypothetical protein HRT89_17840 [Lentisphaeria bacterium]|nr:hypothetical protein [Lentisphaeria bacterium]NQZ69920.1 hypothetical protein [Lentisphaeria bacterium]
MNETQKKHAEWLIQSKKWRYKHFQILNIALTVAAIYVVLIGIGHSRANKTLKKYNTEFRTWLDPIPKQDNAFYKLKEIPKHVKLLDKYPLQFTNPKYTEIVDSLYKYCDLGNEKEPFKKLTSGNHFQIEIRREQFDEIKDLKEKYGKEIFHRIWEVKKAASQLGSSKFFEYTDLHREIQNKHVETIEQRFALLDSVLEMEIEYPFEIKEYISYRDPLSSNILEILQPYRFILHQAMLNDDWPKFKHLLSIFSRMDLMLKDENDPFTHGLIKKFKIEMLIYALSYSRTPQQLKLLKDEMPKLDFDNEEIFARQQLTKNVSEASGLIHNRDIPLFVPSFIFYMEKNDPEYLDHSRMLKRIQDVKFIFNYLYSVKENIKVLESEAFLMKYSKIKILDRTEQFIYIYDGSGGRNLDKSKKETSHGVYKLRLNSEN